MEISQPKVPVLFSEMLQMFPNIPHDIIWMYVQRYSPDIEMCAQMLNQQNAKYSVLEPLSAIDNAKDLNELNFFIQPSHIIPSPQIMFDNNNETELLNKSPIKSDETGVSIKTNASNNHQTEYFPANPSELNSSANFYPNAHENAIPLDISENSNISRQFEPLELHINVDNDDDSGVHSWRPNYSSDVLCSDFFLPSPMQENISLSSSLFSNSNDQHSVSNVQINSDIRKQNSSIYTPSSLQVYDDCLQDGRAYIIDIASHLHYQKSQMNAIRYEVIKAKIELSELKEAEEKLQLELKEKMQTKSVQDIEMLNSEIVQLRLECQCLCTEVDSSLNDQVLLGEIDERCYQRSNSSASTEVQNPVSDSSTQTQQSNNTTRVHDEINRWECSKCTFANHPEIKVCEMCHVAKPSTCDPLYRNAAPTSCFCHPKKDSLSVQS